MSLSPHDLMIRRLCDSFERGQVPSIDELLEPHRSKVKRVKAEIVARTYEADIDDKLVQAAGKMLAAGEFDGIEEEQDGERWDGQS